jgi:hypothetical protein
MLEGAPFSLTACLEILLGLLAINVCIKIGVPVDVDIDISPAPVATTPRVTPGGAERNTCPKGQHGCAESVPGRIPGVGWVSRIWPRSVYHRRVVGRDIHDLRTGRFNFDDLFLDNDFLLLCRFQITGGLGLGAEPLNGIQNIFLLLKKGVAQFLGPIELLAHVG